MKAHRLMKVQTAQLILNLGTKMVVSNQLHAPAALPLRQKLYGGLTRPESLSGHLAQEINLLPYIDLNPRPSSPKPSHYTILYYTTICYLGSSNGICER